MSSITSTRPWAELGHFDVGLFWSVFCDFDLFPNSLEYWGPNGMALFPNIQVRYMPVMGETHLYFALERPGASADQAPSAFKNGQYMLANLLYYPVKNVMAGIEIQYCTRENYSDGWETDMLKVQASFRYKFLQEFYSKK